MQPGVKIRRGLWRHPLVEQRHGLLELGQRPCTIRAGAQMVINLWLSDDESGGQVRKQFANFIALHKSFLFRRILSVASAKFRRRGIATIWWLIHLTSK